MTTITRDTLIALVEAHEAAEIASFIDHGDVDTSVADIGAILNTGTPANEAFAEQIGGDYICALDDGTIAAWGADKVLTHGLIGRDLVFIAPADQVA